MLNSRLHVDQMSTLMITLLRHYQEISLFFCTSLFQPHFSRLETRRNELLAAEETRWHEAWRSRALCLCSGAYEAGAGPPWHTGGPQHPVSLCVHVPGPALPLHALHHRGAVAETSPSCCPQRSVFTAVPPLRSAGRTPCFLRDAVV